MDLLWICCGFIVQSHIGFYNYPNSISTINLYQQTLQALNSFTTLIIIPLKSDEPACREKKILIPFLTKYNSPAGRQAGEGLSRPTPSHIVKSSLPLFPLELSHIR